MRKRVRDDPGGVGADQAFPVPTARRPVGGGPVGNDAGWNGRVPGYVDREHGHRHGRAAAACGCHHRSR
ncbi:hypothetical protein [uncultured Bifidobacterium sp.]|uniref:hypothetical protein n=1 Tax=uncultured Bifidobacterium sp. TaxID=165187 RepID=UPI0025F3514D|nr:hypothetical protein [uncultured Bifidobacterium sp.]